MEFSLMMDDAADRSPWDTESIPGWNTPAYWADDYQTWRTTADPEQWFIEVDCEVSVSVLVYMLTEAGELPRTTPQTILDAGAGLALTPYLFEYWGFSVTALDLCPEAVAIASRYRPTEALLRTYPIHWSSQHSAQGFQAPGGSLAYRAGDWLTADLPTFGVIYCGNGLGGATRAHWAQSLRRFYDRLLPGGVLLLQHQNAMYIRGEVEQLLLDGGFTPLLGDAGPRSPAAKYVLDVWPTG